MRGAEARQAEAERLTLLVADTGTGYFGVNHSNPGYPKPYKAQVSRAPGQLRHRRGSARGQTDAAQRTLTIRQL